MFILSILTVIISSYLILSIMVKDKKEPSFLYFLLIAFSQVVLSFEILSLLTAINKHNFLICNVIFLMVAILFCRLCKTDIHPKKVRFNNILKVLKRDKALMFLGICFIFFCIFQLIMIFAFPVTFGDALGYYLPRCTSWIQNGSIMHYVTPDTRELIMPLNMEFLYSWVLLFTKSEMGIGIFSFISYLGAIYIIYKLLKEFRFKTKQCLWSVFVFTSFAQVVAETSIPSANLFTGTLILGSIYLFLRSVKYENKTALYFSSLSYALAIGTKTTAIIAIPVVFLIFCAISYLYKKSYKYLFYFCLLFIINFFIFSSYNYVLNFLEFNNPLSSYEQFAIHKFTDGIKGYIANIIKYFFAIFDMSGMPEFININEQIKNVLIKTLSFFGLSLQDGASNHFPWIFEYNNKIDITCSALGFIGLIVFLPSLVYAIKHGLKNRNSKISVFMAILALSLLFNILIYSRSVAFIGYNMRLLFPFVMISMPVLAYSYPYKNTFCKIFLCIVMFIYLVVNTHYKPVSYILECFKQNKIIIIKPDTEEETIIYNYFINKNPVNIALMSNVTSKPIFYIEKLKLHGFKIEKILADDIENYNLQKFDYVILPKETGISTNITNFEDRINHPQKYVSRCIYKDEYQEKVNNLTGKRRPVSVNCKIPVEYVKNQGFTEDKDIKTKNYIILKRKQ